MDLGLVGSGFDIGRDFCGFAVVAGHNWPVFFGFKGGKRNRNDNWRHADFMFLTCYFRWHFGYPNYCNYEICFSRFVVICHSTSTVYMVDG